MINIDKIAIHCDITLATPDEVEKYRAKIKAHFNNEKIEVYFNKTLINSNTIQNERKAHI